MTKAQKWPHDLHLNQKKRKRGTITYHVVKSGQGAIDALDKQGKNGFYIGMDNYKNYHTAFIVDAINNRGCKPLFMPSIPFLNSAASETVTELSREMR